VTAFALLAAPLPALAAFAVNIFGPAPYGGLGLTVTDRVGIVGDPHDQNPAAGGISISTFGLGAIPAIPGFSFTADAALTNTPGGPLASELDLQWALTATASGGGTVLITTSATGYTFPGGASKLVSVVDGILEPAGGTSSITAQQWVNLANTIFGMGVVTFGPQGPFSTAAFGSTESTPFTSVAAYSITDRVILTLDAGSTTAGDLNSTVVPEPITMFLGGTGLLVFAYVGRRRLFGR
jgi:hypothetical protein